MWVVLSLTVGTPDPGIFNFHEKCYQIILSYLAVILVATVVGSINTMVLERNREAGEWNGMLRKIMGFLHKRHVSVALQQNILSYLLAWRDKHEQSTDKVFPKGTLTGQLER